MERKPNIIAIVMAIFMIAMGGTPIFGNQVKTLDVRTLQESIREVSTAPVLEVNESDNTITVSLSLNYINIIGDSRSCAQIGIDGFTINMNPGEPETPVKTINHKIPDGMSADVQISDYEYVDIPITLSIAKEPKADILSSNNYLTTTSVCDSNTLYAIEFQSPIHSQTIQRYRGVGILPIVISPIQYDSAKKTARIYKTLKYIISFNPKSTKSVSTNTGNYSPLNISPFDHFLQDIISTSNNKVSSIEKASGELNPQPIRPGYLILTVQSLYSAAQKLSKWKKLLGYDVRIMSRSETGRNVWTQANIKQSISSYANTNPNFYYLLILGDNTQVPGEDFDHPYKSTDPTISTFASDFQYSCLDGEDDIIPDIYIGRIPTNSLEDAMNVVDKIIYAEQNPTMDKSFYKTAFHATEFAQSPHYQGEELECHSYITELAASNMSKNSSFNIKRIYATKSDVYPLKWDRYSCLGDNNIDDSLKRPNFNWNGNAQDIINAINDGCIYGMYRGHGSYTTWGNLIGFNTSNNFNSFHNRGKYPIILAFTCQSGGYNKHNHCIAKEFLTVKEAGASAVIAPTEISYSGLNDALLCALLRGIYPSSNISIDYKTTTFHTDKPKTDSLLCNNINNPRYKLGDALNFAKSIMREHFLGSRGKTYAQLTQRLFHLFGDPSMDLTTDVPQILSNIRINKDASGYTITGSPITTYGAIISIVDTVSNKIMALESLRDCKLEVTNPERCKLCISGHNVKPIIVKDSYGGPWGRGIAKSQNEWTYVDFSNGERHKISPTDDKCFSIKELDGGIVDIDIEGAYVFSHVNSPDKEYWEIGDQIWSRLIDLDSSTAQLPAIQYEFLLGDNENPNNIKVIDYDRITIPNVDFMGALMRVDLLTPDGSDPDYALKVFPYDGECPDFFIETESVSTYIDKYKKCHCIITILPVRYNSVTKEAYVYRHLRLQRTDPASVDLTEIETSDAVYHTIDGRVEPSPETGRIYIRSIGSKREKIVYSGK